MARSASLSQEEIVGIGVAVALHVLLAFLLTMQLGWRDEVLPPPERIAVSLATEVSLQSTAPDPSAEPAAAFAPEIGPEPQAEQVVVDRPVTPRPEPVIQPRTEQPRVTREQPRETVRQPDPPRREAPQQPQKAAPKENQRAQGSRLSDSFLEGMSDSEGSRGTPAATFGNAERAALSSAITRELRPHWSAPSGVDVDQLVTVVAWSLNPDGSLKGAPRCKSQRGITDSNRPQASLHCERAIRAVQLAAPFSTLPEQFYSRWDDLEWDFDRRL